MKAYLIFSFSVLMFFVVSCSGLVEHKRSCAVDSCCKEKSDTELAVLLAPVCARYPEGRIELPYTLPGSEEFRYLSEHPCEYKAALIRVIKNKDSRRADKEIAVYCLQQLCLDDYFEVLDVVMSEFKAKRVDEDLLLTAVIQDGFSAEVAKKYAHPRLQVYLKEVLSLTADKQHQTTVQEFLSGKAWGYMNRRHGKKYPWVCE